MAGKKIEQLVRLLDGKPYLNGTSLSAADIYAFIVLGWSGFLGLTLPAAAQAYVDGIKSNEAMKKALASLAAAGN